MSQRVEVRSIVKNDDRILLLKVASSDREASGKYVLPGDEILEGEQPEDAVRRSLKEQVGYEPNVMYLSDVFTCRDGKIRGLQRTIIVYVVGIAAYRKGLEIAPRFSKFVWELIPAVTDRTLSEVDSIVLMAYTEKPGMSASIDKVQIRSDVTYSSRKNGGILLYTDGGSRGNPGPSAAGYIIKDAEDKLVFEGGVYLGITTNNQAEYHGVRLGLEKAKEIGARSIECYIDSMLVVNQLNGQYVIRNRELWPIHERIKELISGFEKVTFRHIRREFNHQADAVVNKILDARARKAVR